MTCPICQASTEVKDTRKRGQNVWRRRCCKNGHVFSTLEKFIKMQPELKCQVTGLRKHRDIHGAMHRAIYGGRRGEPTYCEHCESWHLTPGVEPANTNEQT